MRSETEVVVEELRRTGEEVVTALRACPTERFEEGRYEDGWNGRQILAHLASADLRVYPRILQLAHRTIDDSVARLAPLDDFPHGFNAREVEARDSMTVPELIEEFARNRAELLDRIGSVPVEVLDVWFTGGRMPSTASTALLALAGQHVRQHVREILGDRP